jgi:hypothetical protein
MAAVIMLEKEQAFVDAKANPKNVRAENQE